MERGTDIVVASAIFEQRRKRVLFFPFYYYSLELVNVTETRLLLMKVRIMSKQPSLRKYPVSDKPFC